MKMEDEKSSLIENIIINSAIIINSIHIVILYWTHINIGLIIIAINVIAAIDIIINYVVVIVQKIFIIIIVIIVIVIVIVIIIIICNI